MPDRRRHRAAAPKDHEHFAPERVPILREGTRHFSWLLSGGYGEKSALKLVGDRFDLNKRQREALRRCAGSDEVRERLARCRVADIRGETLVIDGFNVLITLEVALGGGPVFLARDGCLRDLASLRGTWRRVEETRPAIDLVGDFLAQRGVARSRFLFDAPVSNSGRVRSLVLESAQRAGWSWDVEVVHDADARLVADGAIVATADRIVMERCERWFNLTAELVRERVGQAWIVDLSG